MTEIEKGLFVFEIPLPDNPLKWLNCYVIKGSNNDRNLLIDSGFHRPECLEALLKGIEELHLVPDNTDVLFTHMHTDHTGNGYELFKRGYRILMNRSEYELLFDNKRMFAQRAVMMGFPPEILEEVRRTNQGMAYFTEQFEAEFIEDGQILEYGGRKIQCISTPGHTPGNMCFYDEANGIMFTGDHVLFSISPNIVSWTGYDDCLGAYLESLLKISRYNVRLALPAHRNVTKQTLKERADELIFHHFERLNETLWALDMKPGQSAYEIASKVKWNVKARNWDEFPAGQKWFAVGETMAHLQCLLRRNEVNMIHDGNGVFRYYPL